MTINILFLSIVSALSLAPSSTAQVSTGTLIPNAARGILISGSSCLDYDGNLTELEGNNRDVEHNPDRAVVVDSDAPHRITRQDSSSQTDGWAFGQLKFGESGPTYRRLAWFTQQEGQDRRVLYGPEWAAGGGSGQE
ncbi:hypothetical protein BDW74DRAFT_175607 [Aspergillus multicolor]|uniref:uncharacterized protein n=1 Tax=Aspergillus multicolor TaxID=41759 RepID=UPI003CCDC083